MGDQPVEVRARSSHEARPATVLVLATEPCAGELLLEEIRYRASGPRARVRVAPALTGRLRYWAFDEDRGYAAADARLAESLRECRMKGFEIEGAVGDPDPLQALDDEMRISRPDEVIVATHALDRANWLERDLVAQARAPFEVPITHLVVEPERDRARRAVHADEPGPPAERHCVRDVALLVAAVMLAIVGTLVSFLLYDADVPTPLLAAWC